MQRWQDLLNITQLIYFSYETPSTCQRILGINLSLSVQCIKDNAALWRVFSRLVFLYAPVIVGEDNMIRELTPPLLGEVIGIAVINQNALVVLRLWLIACIVEHLAVVVDNPE